MRQLKDYKNYEIRKGVLGYSARNYAGGLTDYFETLDELKSEIDSDRRSETECVYDSLYELYSSNIISENDLFNDSVYAFCSGYMPKVSIQSVFKAVMQLRDKIDE